MTTVKSVTLAQARAAEESYEKRLRSGEFFFPHGGLSVSVGPGLGGGSASSAVAIEDISYPPAVSAGNGSGRVRPQCGV